MIKFSAKLKKPRKSPKKALKTPLGRERERFREIGLFGWKDFTNGQLLAKFQTDPMTNELQLAV